MAWRKTKSGGKWRKHRRSIEEGRKHIISGYREESKEEKNVQSSSIPQSGNRQQLSGSETKKAASLEKEIGMAKQSWQQHRHEKKSKHENQQRQNKAGGRQRRSVSAAGGVSISHRSSSISSGAQKNKRRQQALAAAKAAA